jgi:hypothetical protein
MKIPIATFVFLLSAASGFSAAAPAAPELQWTPIALDRDPGATAIGVEPLGGAFARVIEPDGTPREPFRFSILSKQQGVGILSIYATNQSFIPLEKPLARVRLKTLKPGETHHRLAVSMKWSTDRKLLISAWDDEHHHVMKAEKLTPQDVLAAHLKEEDHPSVDARKLTAQEARMTKLKLPAIAAGPGAEANRKTPDEIKPSKYIGVRVTGGMFEPVLAIRPDGKLTTTKIAPGKTYIRTAFQGARTADLTLFAGTSPYIEKNERYGHYIISGMTNPQQNNSFQLELQPEPNGKLKLIAYELEPGAKPGKGEYKHALTVDKYSRSALDRLLATGQLGQSSTEGQVRNAGLIPADPTH